MLHVIIFVLLIQIVYGQQCAEINIIGDKNYYPLALFSNSSYDIFNKTLIPIGNACHYSDSVFPQNFIAIADRGDCDFVTKAQNALRMNASALIVVNYDAKVFPMYGDINVPIVAFMVDNMSGQKLKDNKNSNINIILNNCFNAVNPHLMGLILPSFIALVIMVIVLIVKTYDRENRTGYVRLINFHTDIDEFCEQLEQNNNIPDTICIICLDTVVHSDLEQTCYLKCKHSYHRECISTWFRTKTECPICKFKY